MFTMNENGSEKKSFKKIEVSEMTQRVKALPTECSPGDSNGRRRELVPTMYFMPSTCPPWHVCGLPIHK